MVGGLIVTHGALAQVLVEEACRLLGPQERFAAMPTEGLSAEQISEGVRARIGEDPCLIFTDTPGTSPTVRSCAAIGQGQVVVTGVNLGMLISFLGHRARLAAPELAQKMIDDGRRSLKVILPPELER